MAGELGFEPRLTESESAVLPLNYSPPNVRQYLNIFVSFYNSARKVLQIRASIYKPQAFLTTHRFPNILQSSEGMNLIGICSWSSAMSAFGGKADIEI